MKGRKKARYQINRLKDRSIERKKGITLIERQIGRQIDRQVDRQIGNENAQI